MSREAPIEWIASIVAMICTTLRALNIEGTQTLSYLVSCLAYLVFFYHARKPSQSFLNLFYLVIALIGAYRWSSTHTA